jgi:hypothetical protein
VDQGPTLGFPFDWLVQLAVSVVLLWGTGGLVARVLAPRTYRRDALLIAPFLGFGILKDHPIHFREPLAVWAWTVTDLVSPMDICR